MNEQLVLQLTQIAIKESPLIIEGLRALFKKAHPDAPSPSDAEVVAAYESAFRSSLAKDAAWLAAHGDI